MEKSEVLREKADYSGLFKFDDFYAYANSWLKDEKYISIEEKYSEKITEKGKNLDIVWRATKLISDYFKLELWIRFQVTEMKDVEVEIDGERKKMNKGKIEIEVRGNLFKDPEGKWDTSAFYRMLRDFYDKYIIPRRKFDMEETARKDARGFKEDLKAWLDLTGRR
jgi:hypothetical protein